jgi:hypothetical protein
MDDTTRTIIAAAVPTLAVVAAFVRNETALSGLAGRIETLDRDLREWARITMRHNTDIARLKDKIGLKSDGD